MLTTAVTERIGIKYPIVAGCMMSMSTAECVSACSNAGGLGTLANMIYQEPEALRQAVRRIKALTDKPFSANLNRFPSLVPIGHAARRVLEIEAGKPGDPTQVFFAAAGTKAKEMFDHGDLSLGVVSCGQGIGMTHDIPSVAALFSGMAAEAEASFYRFAAMGH